MRSTDELIAALVNDLRPVTPLPAWPVRLALWATWAGLWVALWLLVVGGRVDVWRALGSITTWPRSLMLLTAGIGSAAVALRRGTPGDTRGWDPLVAGPVVLWLLVPWSAEWSGPLALDWTCVALCAVGALVPSLLLATLVAGAAPGYSPTTHVLTAVGGVSLGALTAGLACGHTDAGHQIASHVAPVALALVGCVAVCSGCVLPDERTFRD